MTRSRHDELREKVIEFHGQHPQVWALFKKFTFEKINKGFKHYSARGVFHRIRWETDQAVTDDNEFKMNDHHSPFYARAFMKKHPQYEGFFRTRTQISKDVPPVCLPELTPSYFDPPIQEK